MAKASNGRVRIFNWGWYGFENFGDDLLQNTMMEKFLSIPQAEICFAMNTPYSFDNERITQCGRTYRNLAVYALKSDCLIIGPGGLFPFQNTAKCLLMYITTGLWFLLGRKVIFFGIGVSPQMNKLNAFLWRRMIRHSALFLTRSDGLLETVGLSETAQVNKMADAAFASQAADCRDRKPSNQKKIGIAVANISNGVGSVYKEFVDIWSDTVNFFLQQGYKVDLIAFTKGADDMLIRDIYKNIPLKYMGGGIRLLL